MYISDLTNMLSDAVQQGPFMFTDLKWLEDILRYIYLFKYSYINNICD